MLISLTVPQNQNKIGTRKRKSDAEVFSEPDYSDLSQTLRLSKLSNCLVT